MHFLNNMLEGDWGLLFRERRSLSSFRVLNVPPATLLFLLLIFSELSLILPDYMTTIFILYTLIIYYYIFMFNG